MKNTSEFIFDEVLDTGFTVVPNGIFDDTRLTYGAIGMYSKIVRSRNIKGWKVYQSSLVNDKNGKTKIMSAMKELIENGWIEKVQLRNEKGHMCGVNYKVYSKSIKPVIESFAPKTEKLTSDNQTSEKLTSENEPLKIKNNKKKENTNKDYNKSSSSSEEDEVEKAGLDSLEISIEEENKEIQDKDLNRILGLCQGLNIKLSRKNTENLLQGFGVESICQALIKISATEKFVNGEIRNINGYLTKVLVDMVQEKKVINNITVNKQEKIKTFTNYDQREIHEDESMYGWDE
ncbi:MAG: hypothetical protein ACRC6T_11555 [Sarcina sp.]